MVQLIWHKNGMGPPPQRFIIQIGKLTSVFILHRIKRGELNKSVYARICSIHKSWKGVSTLGTDGRMGTQNITRYIHAMACNSVLGRKEILT